MASPFKQIVMNKLLLLATSLFCLNLEGYSAGIPQDAIEANLTDSTKKEKKANLKDGFKDLFETGTNTLTIHKLNPRAINFVKDYMDSEGKRLTEMKKWGKPYFDKINSIFTRYDLPVEMKYLAVIESDLRTSATSHVGAAGPWQFMPATARELGLKVSRSNDERRDFNKSTVAAARYLTKLFDKYGDWLLVIAAYNGGPGKVNDAIRKSGSRNFWDLQNYLPAESKNHVKKFIATHYIMEGDGGETTLTKKENETLALMEASLLADANTSMIAVTGKYNSTALTRIIAMDPLEFNKLNPGFDKLLSANGTYNLRLPVDKMTLFQANKPLILEKSVELMLSMVSR